jgi:hypothetical protein
MENSVPNPPRQTSSTNSTGERQRRDGEREKRDHDIFGPGAQTPQRLRACAGIADR